MDNKCWRPLLSAFIILFFCGNAFAGNYFNKRIKNTFISPALNKNFYNIEVQTLKFLDSQSSNVNGLVESFRGTSRFTFDIITRAFCYGQGGVLDCQSFTYRAMHLTQPRTTGCGLFKVSYGTGLTCTAC